jgi:hypothetical protein
MRLARQAVVALQTRGHSKHPLYVAYAQQRSGARIRVIDWLFTFETWLAWWEATGCLPGRGRRRGQFVMARNGDTGPYSPENVHLSTQEGNSTEAGANRRQAREESLSRWCPFSFAPEPLRVELLESFYPQQ